MTWLVVVLVVVLVLVGYVFLWGLAASAAEGDRVEPLRRHQYPPYPPA